MKKSDFFDGDTYTDVPGFCKAATLDEIRSHDYVLTPGRYVGAADVEDDGEPFEEKMERLTATLAEQFGQSMQLQRTIAANLGRLGYGEEIDMSADLHEDGA